MTAVHARRRDTNPGGSVARPTAGQNPLGGGRGGERRRRRTRWPRTRRTQECVSERCLRSRRPERTPRKDPSDGKSVAGAPVTSRPRRADLPQPRTGRMKRPAHNPRATSFTSPTTFERLAAVKYRDLCSRRRAVKFSACGGGSRSWILAAVFRCCESNSERVAPGSPQRADNCAVDRRSVRRQGPPGSCIARSGQRLWETHVPGA